MPTSADLPAYVVCSGGPRDGNWFTGKHWQQATASAVLDQADPTTDRTLGYEPTEETRVHPDPKRGITGTVYTWKGRP